MSHEVANTFYPCGEGGFVKSHFIILVGFEVTFYFDVLGFPSVPPRKNPVQVI